MCSAGYILLAEQKEKKRPDEHRRIRAGHSTLTLIFFEKRIHILPSFLHYLLFKLNLVNLPFGLDGCGVRNTLVLVVHDVAAAACKTQYYVNYQISALKSG